MIEKTAKRTAVSKLYATLQNDIICGVLPPGARLNLRELSERYKAGMIPLREALSRLSSIGFVSVQDQRGFSVASISRSELSDTQELRAELECIALRDSIAHGDARWEADLIAALHLTKQLQKQPEKGRLSLDPEWEMYHGEFHAKLLAACRNQVLLRTIEQLFLHSRRYRQAMMLATKPFTRDVPAEHQAIVDAAVARDADLACALLRQHYRRTEELVLDAMK